MGVEDPMHPGAADGPALDAASFRLAFEQAPVAMAVTSLEGRFLRVNPALCRLLGRTEADLVGIRWQDVTHPDDLGRSLVSMEAASAQGHDYEIEKRYLTGDGRVVWVVVTVSVVTDEQGAPHHFVAHMQDVTDHRQAEHALRASEEGFRLLAETSPTALLAVDTLRGCTYANRRFLEFAGLSAVGVSGDGWAGVVHPHDRPSVLDTVRDAAGRRRSFALQARLAGRGDRWFRLTGQPLATAPGEPGAVVVTVEDATLAVESARDAEEARARLAALVEATTDLVAICDASGRNMQVNPAWRSLLGLDSAEDVTEMSMFEFYTGESRRRLRGEVFTALRERGVWRGELTLLGRDSRQVPVSQVIHAHRGTGGDIDYLSTIAHDLSDRKRLEERLAHQALHDPLTGLPNRTLFRDRLAVAVARSERAGTRVAVLFCDLDHFKEINDTLGHATGDRLLTAVGPKLTSVLRPFDTVARVGGDEFAVVCEGVTDEAEALAIAERVRHVLQQPVALDPGEEKLVAGASIGMAVAEPGVDLDDLLAAADVAMYHAKQAGGGRVETFRDWMRARVDHRRRVEREVRRGIDAREFTAHFQPMLALPSLRVEGVEAVARWRHPDRGLLEPDEFVAIAEASGLIVALGAEVLRAALREAEALRPRDPRSPVIWINVSSRQLQQVAFLDLLARELHDAGLQPDRIGIEIDELAFAADDRSVSAAWVHALRGTGVRVAIDHFGTRDGALALLREMPVDMVKLDMAVVTPSGAARRPAHEATVNAVVALAHEHGAVVAVTGVTDRASLRRLETQGVDLVQGTGLTPPLPAADLATYLESGAL